MAWGGGGVEAKMGGCVLWMRRVRRDGVLGYGARLGKMASVAIVACVCWGGVGVYGVEYAYSTRV